MSFGALAQSQDLGSIAIEASGKVKEGRREYTVRIWTEDAEIKVSYPEWNCAGTLKLASRSGNRLEFDERLRPGSHGCGTR